MDILTFAKPDYFFQVVSKVMEVYKPNAVVLQCGADSLAGDRLGCFNLSLKGTDHNGLVRYQRLFKILVKAIAKQFLEVFQYLVF